MREGPCLPLLQSQETGTAAWCDGNIRRLLTQADLVNPRVTSLSLSVLVCKMGTRRPTSQKCFGRLSKNNTRENPWPVGLPNKCSFPSLLPSFHRKFPAAPSRMVCSPQLFVDDVLSRCCLILITSGLEWQRAGVFSVEDTHSL